MFPPHEAGFSVCELRPLPGDIDSEPRTYAPLRVRGLPGEISRISYKVGPCYCGSSAATALPSAPQPSSRTPSSVAQATCCLARYTPSCFPERMSLDSDPDSQQPGVGECTPHHPRDLMDQSVTTRLSSPRCSEEARGGAASWLRA